MTKIDPKRAKLVLPDGAGEIQLRDAMPTVAMTGFAPTVLVSDNKLVEPGPIEYRLEGFAPEVIIAPAKGVEAESELDGD